MTTVGEVMSHNLLTVESTTPLEQAAARMSDRGVGAILVLSGDSVSGILTERDVLRAAASGEDLSASTVSAWMSPDPQSASPGTSAEDAAQIMLLNGFLVKERGYRFTSQHLHSQPACFVLSSLRRIREDEGCCRYGISAEALWTQSNANTLTR